MNLFILISERSYLHDFRKDSESRAYKKEQVYFYAQGATFGSERSYFHSANEVVRNTKNQKYTLSLFQISDYLLFDVGKTDRFYGIQ